MMNVLDFCDIHMKIIREVGGRNAIQAEIFNELKSGDVLVPDGFVVTTSAYWRFLNHGGLGAALGEVLSTLDVCQFSNLAVVGREARNLVSRALWPERIQEDILAAHERLVKRGCP